MSFNETYTLFAYIKFLPYVGYMSLYLRILESLS